MKTKTKEQATADLLLALKFFRHAINDANKEGVAQFGIMQLRSDSTKRVVMTFDCEAFFADLETALDAPADTVEDEAAAKAAQFVQQHGLTVQLGDE